MGNFGYSTIKEKPLGSQLKVIRLFIAYPYGQDIYK
jgi:hypothetical protein